MPHGIGHSRRVYLHQYCKNGTAGVTTVYNRIRQSIHFYRIFLHDQIARIVLYEDGAREHPFPHVRIQNPTTSRCISAVQESVDDHACLDFILKK